MCENLIILDLAKCSTTNKDFQYNDYMVPTWFPTVLINTLGAITLKYDNFLLADELKMLSFDSIGTILQHKRARQGTCS